MAAPFVKWVGGKGRILDQLAPLLPRDVGERRHMEPFVGGGALFFGRDTRNAVLSDVNHALINAYETVRDDVEALIARLGSLASNTSEVAYYAHRDAFNAGTGSSVERAALFIFLNKTCFNGLYRVNRRGEFNVPAGRYKHPRVLDADALRAASAALEGVQLCHGDFAEFCATARPGDFVYFDPPYVPLSATSSFTSYAQDGFSHEDQERLRDVFRALDRRGCKLMLSNSDAPAVHALYEGFRIDRVRAPRAINRDASKRGPVSEVVVRNYADSAAEAA